jgi:hypothetical protein
MKLKNNTVFDCSVLDVSMDHNKAGNITVAENMKNIQFNVKRVYYLFLEEKLEEVMFIMNWSRILLLLVAVLMWY